MPPYVRLLAIAPLLLLAACDASREQRTAQLLDERLKQQLATDIAANRAVLQPLPDGARVTLLDRSLFPANTDALDDRETDPRASVIEGLLDPYLMRVQIADTTNLPPDQREARVRNVVRYFVANGLALTLEPAQQVPAGAPSGLAITISVVCPHRNDGSGYDSGARKAGCF